MIHYAAFLFFGLWYIALQHQFMEARELFETWGIYERLMINQDWNDVEWLAKLRISIKGA